MLSDYGSRGLVWAAALASLSTVACLGQGSVELDLVFPADSLSPTQLEPTELRLIHWSPGELPTTAVGTIAQGSASMDLGEIEAGDAVRLAVELRSSTQRLVGYGRAADLITVEPGGVTKVSIHMRRPFAYITGGRDITSVDSLRDATSTTDGYVGAIDALAGAQIAVPTYDGTALLVVADSLAPSLYLLSTADHQEITLGPVPVQYPAVDAAVSTDGRYAVLAHDLGNGQGGVSIVDLAAVRDGAEVVGAVSFVSLGPVSRVVIPEESSVRAFALINRVTGRNPCDSPEPSSIVSLVLSRPADPVETIPYQGKLHDVGVSEDGLYIVGANGCQGVVEHIERSGTVEELFQLDRVGALAIREGLIWAVGTVPGAAPEDDPVISRLRIMSSDLAGDNELAVDLSPLQERMTILGLDIDGQSPQQLIDADELQALDLIALPGGDAVAVLVQARFVASELRDQFGNLILPRMDARTHEYLLVDLATAAPVQRVRTHCDLDISPPNAPVPFWECGASIGQEATEDPYVPIGISVLHGSR